MTHRTFGSVRKLPSRRYQARYTGPDGQQHSGPSTYPTKADARAWLAQQESRIRDGQWVNPTAGMITLSTYSAQWLEAKTNIRQSTRTLYEGLLRIHILPTLGATSLRDIDSITIRKWYGQLSDESTGHNTRAKIYRLLKQILATAVDDDLISKSPCRIRGGGQERVPERPIPSIGEVSRIIEAVDARYRAPVTVATYVGLRFGELAGLQRKHINPLKREITIEQQLSTVNGKKQISLPKTAAGRRTLTMPESVAILVDLHLEQYADPSPDSFVFTTANGATLERGCFRRRVWLPACEQAGVTGVRFHDLRHVAATLAASSGVSLKSLMHRMGHSTPEAALIYQHAVREDEQAIAHHIDGAINS